MTPTSEDQKTEIATETLEAVAETVKIEGAPEDKTQHVKMVLNAGDLGMTDEEIAEFATLTDEGERNRAKTHRKKMISMGKKPICPSEWLECPLCAQQIAEDGKNEFGDTRPYRTPESMVTHYTSHGGLNTVAAKLKIMPEQLTIVHPILQAELKEKGADNQPKSAGEKAA